MSLHGQFVLVGQWQTVPRTWLSEVDAREVYHALPQSAPVKRRCCLPSGQGIDLRAPALVPLKALLDPAEVRFCAGRWVETLRAASLVPNAAPVVVTWL